MKELLAHMFHVKPRKQKENTSPSSPEEEVKGYMLIRHHLPVKSLPIDDYLEGRKDEALKNVGLLEGRYPVYETIEKLLEANKGREPTFDRSCYILSLRTSREETYALMRSGEFHKAVISAESFEDVVEAKSRQKVQSIR